MAAVRYPLALLLHRLESHSALAGLRSCRSAAQKAMWLDVFIPEDDAAPLEHPTQDQDWGLECLPLPPHHPAAALGVLRSAREAAALAKAQFIELCAPEWSAGRVASMRQGVCRQFVLEDPLLRRVATIAAQGQADETQPQDVELARVLDALWVDERDRFRDDVQEIVAAEFASRDVGISADRISTLIGAALLPAHAHVDDWHPADICIQHWRMELILRHALQLFLLIDGRFEPSGEGDFALELIERAASSCLARANAQDGPAADRIAAWLGTAQRCINYAQKMHEDCGVQLSHCASLQQIQLCADFCSRVVLKHEGSGVRELDQRLEQALVHMATSDRLSHDLLVRVLSTLLTELRSSESEAGEDAAKEHRRVQIRVGDTRASGGTSS